MSALRCPNCRAALTVDPKAAAGVVCAECGTKLKRKPVEPAAPAKPAIKKSRVAALDDEDDQPRKKKLKPKKNSVKLSRVHIGGAIAAVAVMGALLIYFTGLGGGRGGGSGESVAEIAAPVDADRHLPAVTPPKLGPVGAKADPEADRIAALMKQLSGEAIEPVALDAKEWTLPPDGPAAPRAVLNPQFQPVACEVPVLSSGTGQYLINMPADHAYWKRYLPLNRAPGEKGLRKWEARTPKQLTVPVIDLKTLESIGEFSHLAPYWNGGILAPDGRHIVGPESDVDRLKTLEEGKLFVWKLGESAPARHLELRGAVLWADFAAPREFAAITFDETSVKHPMYAQYEVTKRTFTFWLFDVTDGRKIHEAELKDGDVAYRHAWESKKKPNEQSYDFNFGEMTESYAGTEKPNVLYYYPDPLLGAVGPGGQRIYIGGTKGITVLGVKEGRVLARLPIDASTPLYRDDYMGFSFNADGSELRAVAAVSRKDKSNPLILSTTSRSFRYLLCWDPRTGKGTHTAELKDGELCGPLYDGPDATTLVAGWRHTRKLDGVSHRQVIKWTYSYTGFGGAVINRVDGTEAYRLPQYLLGQFQPGLFLKQGKRSEVPKNAPPVGLPRAVEYQSLEVEQLKAPETALDPWEQFVAKNPRPAMTRADRGALAAGAPAQPAAWAVLAAAAPVVFDPVGTFGSWPTSWGEFEAATVQSAGEPVANAIHHVAWIRHDLKTGHAATPIVLWPWITRTAKSPGRFLPKLAAVSRAGDRLALRDPDDLARVDAFDAAGKWLVGFQPYGNDRVDGVIWCGPTRLLTQSNGRLTGWDLPACKAVFEIADCPNPLLPPGRTWVAKATDAQVEFVDTATGRGLGRIATPGPWRHTSLSPDGKLLVRAAAGNYRKPDDPASGFGSQIRSWDLATGVERTAIAIEYPIDDRAAWCSPRRLVVPDGSAINTGNGFVKTTVRIVDLDVGAAVAAIGPPKNHGEPNSQDHAPLRADPFGRWWVAVPGFSSSVSYAPTRFDLAKLPEGDAKPYAFRPGVPIRVKVELDGHARPAGERIAAILQRSGHTIAPDGWLLHMKAEPGESTMRMQASPNDATGEAVPKFNLTWKLVDPAGREAWSQRTEARWKSGASKYNKGTDHSRGGMANQDFITVTHFDFRGRAMRGAVLDEIAADLGTTISLPDAMPPALLDAGGGSVPLPVRGEYSVPAKK